jgi:hypothetical protein
VNRPPELACPACGYDVSDLLEREVARCPECGVEISRVLCDRQYRQFARARWTWWCAAIAPSLILASVGPMFDGSWPTRRWTIPLGVVYWWLLTMPLWCLAWNVLFFRWHAPRAWPALRRHLIAAPGTIMLILANVVGFAAWIWVQVLACGIVDMWRGD